MSSEILRARLRVESATAARRIWTSLTKPYVNAISAVEYWLAKKTILCPGTRVRLNGKCCRGTEAFAGRLGTITDHSHDRYDQDYHVRIDGKFYPHDEYIFDYVCPNGFDVVDYR